MELEIEAVGLFYNQFSSDDDDDDDLERVGEIATRNENYLEETVNQYSDQDFFINFRVSKELTNQITAHYEVSGIYKSDNGQYGNIPAKHQVLIFLWFIGHQTASFADVSDRFNITKSSVVRVVRRLVVFLSNMSHNVIKWPDNQEKLIIEQQFRENGFPNIIGAIDGCHLKIDKPINDPDSYINRKGYHSVQMQVVCDKNLKIRDVFIGYPGSVHDSRVFRNSPLYQSLEEKCNNYHILGDSGYPLHKNLLTPFKDRGQLTDRQLYYNVQLSKNRYVIEHCFGVLKQKFRQMYHIKLRNMEYIVHLIRAACVLHNLALEDDFHVEIDDEIDAGDNPIQNAEFDFNLDQDEEEIQGDRNAMRIRDAIVNSLP